MKSNNSTARIISATLALWAGILVLLFGHHLSWLGKTDITCVGLSNKNDPSIIEYDQAAGSITIRPLIKNPTPATPIHLIAIGNDPGNILESTPPSPLDYAVILESLHNQGYRHITVTTHLTWENTPDILPAAGLDSRLARFDSAVISLALTRGPSDGETPPYLNNSLIKPSQITGDTSLIPLANRVALPLKLGGQSKDTLAGFHTIENNPHSTHHIPMLARWADQGLIPSVELLTLMQLHACPPSELIIHAGKHIRLGKNGPVIPVDRYGQNATPSQVNNTPHKKLTATSIITPNKSNHTTEAIALIHAEGKKVNHTNTLTPTRLHHLLTLSNNYPVPGKGTPLHKLPLWANLTILAITALLVLQFRCLSRSTQHLTFALTAALTLVLLAAIIDISQHWFPVTAPLTTLLIGWLIPSKNKQLKTSN